jgi:hypothetical protein
LKRGLLIVPDTVLPSFSRCELALDVSELGGGGGEGSVQVRLRSRSDWGWWCR